MIDACRLQIDCRIFTRVSLSTTSFIDVGSVLHTLTNSIRCNVFGARNAPYGLFSYDGVL